MPAIKLLWEMRTPFGTPVDPLVYMMTATSEGNGDLRSRATVIITEKIAQTQAPSPTPGAGKAAGMNASAVDVLKDSGKNASAEKRSSDVSRQKKKRTTGCRVLPLASVSSRQEVEIVFNVLPHETP